MQKGLFKKVNINGKHQKWEKCIQRSGELYPRDEDIRSPFARDYNRILHCTAFRRLKNKTQVFFAPTNDHICTRMEHVNHVTAISYNIAKFLGLNTELTTAIAMGHDLGHAPFGHAGETFIQEITKKEIGENFWHEKNSLRFVDKCETLEDPQRNHRNLFLTYAVRDGIICHCGEADEKLIFPREEFIDLTEIEEPNQYRPFTWEGCVVKIADQISYLGRDIEDAFTLKILTMSQMISLLRIVKPYSDSRIKQLNNTVFLHDFIIDLCKHSTPENGLKVSDNTRGLLDAVKNFNKDNIYNHQRLNTYKQYAELIINTIFETLKSFYRKDRTLEKMGRHSSIYPTLVKVFREWLEKYAELNNRPPLFKNEILYNLDSKEEYLRAVIDFISGMTDMFAIKLFTEITTFF